jgi:hypothetical protein
MHDYTVLAVTPSGAEHAICLADADGGLHVARATATVPPVGARLLGGAPKLGFGLLLGAPIDEVFRVIFEQVHCSRDEVHRSPFGILHPEQSV